MRVEFDYPSKDYWAEGGPLTLTISFEDVLPINPDFSLDEKRRSDLEELLLPVFGSSPTKEYKVEIQGRTLVVTYWGGTQAIGGKRGARLRDLHLALYLFQTGQKWGPFAR